MEMRIFRKQGDSCELEQTLTGTGNTISVDLSADHKQLASCNAYLHLFRHDGTQFVLSQTISLGFNCLAVNFIGDLVEVNGMTPEILFYEFNGSQYESSFTLFTNDSSIKQLSISEDQSQIMFGGSSQNVSAYSLNAGVFQLSEQLETLAPIQELFVDRTQLYFVVSTSIPAIKVFYRCPSECSGCYFPNNCSSCVQGYHLEGGVCIRDPTHCVQNIFIGNGICK